MTKREKEENDWKFGDNRGNRKRLFPHNPLDKFYCPVCGTVRYGKEMRRVDVMDNGIEVTEY